MTGSSDDTDTDVLLGVLAVGAVAAGTPSVRLVGILNALCEATGSVLCAATCCDDLVPGRPLRIVGVIEAGALGDDARAKYLRYLNDEHADDPFFAAFAAHLLGRPVGTRDAVTTFLRQDLVPDSIWYACRHVRVYRQPAGVDSCIYSVADGDREGRIWSMGLHRPWAAEQFTDRERRFVCSLHRALIPLMQQCWSESDGLGEIVNQLPMRLQKTLMLLVEGDSEKEIAQRLGLRPSTIHDYVKQIHRKVGVTSRAGLLVKVLGQGVHRYAVSDRPKASSSPPARAIHGPSCSSATPEQGC